MTQKQSCPGVSYSLERGQLDQDADLLLIGWTTVVKANRVLRLLGLMAAEAAVIPLDLLKGEPSAVLVQMLFNST